MKYWVISLNIKKLKKLSRKYSLDSKITEYFLISLAFEDNSEYFPSILIIQRLISTKVSWYLIRISSFFSVYSVLLEYLDY